MNVDELIELEQELRKAKIIADILFSDVAENVNESIPAADHERYADLSGILVDYLAAANKEIIRLEKMAYGKAETEEKK